MEAVMPPVSQAPRRYFIEFNLAMAFYIAAVVGRKFLLPGVSDPVWRDAILVFPILPICLVALAVVRFYRRMDEYRRLHLLQALAFSAGVTAVVSASWGFLEDVGLPHLELIHALMVMMLSLAAAALFFGWKDKVSERRAGQALRSICLTLIYVAAGTALFAGAGMAAGFATPWWELALMAAVLFIARIGFFIFAESKSC
jgi:hypothetical protein